MRSEVERTYGLARPVMKRCSAKSALTHLANPSMYLTRTMSIVLAARFALRAGEFDIVEPDFQFGVSGVSVDSSFNLQFTQRAR